MSTNKKQSDFEARWQQIRGIWQSYVLEYRLLVLLIFILMGLWVFGQNGFGLNDNMLGYVTNIFIEILSIIVTVLVVDKLIQRRNTENAKTILQEDLVRRAGSLVNDVAVDAVGQLKKEGWLRAEDSLLNGSNLYEANLQGATLSYSSLQEANLTSSNLREANLHSADLKRARLDYAKLQEADLWFAKLQRAQLSRANLENANMESANLMGALLDEANLQQAYLVRANLYYASLDFTNLQKANLTKANLEGSYVGVADLREVNFKLTNLKGCNLAKSHLRDATNIESARFDETTVLPDNNYWTQETDITRYTNPNHPDFWMPKWATAGFASALEWYNFGELQPSRVWSDHGRSYPWREAGYGNDHMAWWHDGNQDYQPKYKIAGFTSYWEWRNAGYGNDHMAWARDGKLSSKPENE